MDHMEYSIALPSCVEVTNAGAEWTTMKQRLFIHLNPNASSFRHMAPNLITSFLINISLEQVQDIFNMYGLSIEETLRFNKILKSIEDVCLPRFLILYNRYRFFTCKQNGPEFNGFLQQLLAWSDLCEFGDLKDILLKDCILSGITEESVRQHLLRTEQLDFHKTVEICKAGLVRKHGYGDAKYKENNCTDAWTATENDMMDNMAMKPQMMDEATNVSIRTTERQTQTDVISTCDACCEVIGEKDLMRHTELLDDVVFDKYINTADDLPLFVDKNDVQCVTDTVHIQPEFSHEQNINMTDMMAGPDSQPVVQIVAENQFNTSCSNQSISNGKEINNECVRKVDKGYFDLESTSVGANIECLRDNPLNITDSRTFRDYKNLRSTTYKPDHQQQMCDISSVNSNTVSDLDKGTLRHSYSYRPDHQQQMCDISSVNSNTVSDLDKGTLRQSYSYRPDHQQQMCDISSVNSNTVSDLDKGTLRQSYSYRPDHQQQMCDISSVNSNTVSDLDKGTLRQSYRPDHQQQMCDISSVNSNTVSLRQSNNTKNDKKFHCESCTASFRKASQLKVHRYVHSGNHPYVCLICGKGYVEAYKLKIHERNHTGERPYKCTDCNKSFKWSTAFTRHKKIHKGIRPYSCDRCNATFVDSTSLQRHFLSHSKDRPYQCMCGSTFTNPSALRVHKRIHTGERPFSCTICSASFIRAQHLKQHMKFHSGEKPYECKTCHTKFLEASKLKSHMRKHTGEKPYMCKICGKSFAWTAAYKRHIRTHTLEKPYVCRFCGSAFVDNSNLVRHQRIHTGERPYRCTHCTSSFVDSSSLSRHEKIHSGEKAYTCDICGASFSVKSYLNRHLRIHSSDKPYACDVCSAKFNNSSKLNRHKKIHKRPESEATQVNKSTKTMDFLHPQPPVDPNPMSEKTQLAQLHEHDLGSYLSRPFQFDPTQDRSVHDFDDMPVTNSVIEAFLNMKS